MATKEKFSISKASIFSLKLHKIHIQLVFILTLITIVVSSLWSLYFLQNTPDLEKKIFWAMEIWNYVIQESARKVCQIQTVKEVIGLNDLTKLEGGEGTRNYEGQGCCYLIRRFSQLEKGWEKKQWWKGNKHKQDGFKKRQGISRLFQTACTILRNMILSTELSRQTYNTPSYQIEQTYPLLMHLMAQQVMYRMSLNGKMI